MLMMTIGEAGDALDDPTQPWPAKRIRVVMGTLTLTEVAEDQAAAAEHISFNPCRLAPGIEASGDPDPRCPPGRLSKSRAKCAADVPSRGVRTMPIPSDEGRVDRFVDRLPDTGLSEFVASRILVPFWAWRTPVKPLPGGPHPSFRHGDNVQRMMNLVMPLRTSRRSDARRRRWRSRKTRMRSTPDWTMSARCICALRHRRRQYLHVLRL